VGETFGFIGFTGFGFIGFTDGEAFGVIGFGFIGFTDGEAFGVAGLGFIGFTDGEAFGVAGLLAGEAFGFGLSGFFVGEVVGLTGDGFTFLITGESFGDGDAFGFGDILGDGEAFGAGEDSGFSLPAFFEGLGLGFGTGLRGLGVMTFLLGEGDDSCANISLAKKVAIVNNINAIIRQNPIDRILLFCLNIICLTPFKSDLNIVL